MSRNEIQTRTAPFQIRLLDHFQPVYTGNLITNVTSARLQSLLAYRVLFTDVPKSRRYLASLFWPKSTESQASTNLRQTLHNLKQVVPHADRFLQSDIHTIHWRTGVSFSLDVAVLKQAAA
jgi:DNA-binding SARP family transcriptional activator